MKGNEVEGKGEERKKKGREGKGERTLKTVIQQFWLEHMFLLRSHAGLCKVFDRSAVVSASRRLFLHENRDRRKKNPRRRSETAIRANPDMTGADVRRRGAWNDSRHRQRRARGNILCPTKGGGAERIYLDGFHPVCHQGAISQRLTGLAVSSRLGSRLSCRRTLRSKQAPLMVPRAAALAAARPIGNSGVGAACWNGGFVGVKRQEKSEGRSLRRHSGRVGGGPCSGYRIQASPALLSVNRRCPHMAESRTAADARANVHKETLACALTPARTCRARIKERLLL